MTISLYYRKEKESIFLKIQHKQDKKSVKIAACLPEHWNQNMKMITGKHPDFENIYPFIMDLQVRAKIIMRKNYTSSDQVKALIFESENKDPSFMLWICDYLDNKRKIMLRYNAAGNIIERNRTSGHINHYNDVYQKLKIYYKEIPYSIIDRSFVKNLQNMLFADLALSDSTAARYLGRIKSLHGKMVQDLNLINTNAWDVPINKVTARAFQGRRKRLSNEQLAQLYTVQLFGNMQRATDMYLCLFELGGCDLIDFYYLKWTDLHQGYISFERSKVRGSDINIMCSMHVWRFIVRYGQPGAQYVFPWDKSITGYKTWRRNVSRDLKIACTKMNVTTVTGANVSLKTARHTFSSRAKELGIDGDLLRELMGHQRNDIDNYYKDLFAQNIRDNAHLKVINITL